MSSRLRLNLDGSARSLRVVVLLVAGLLLFAWSFLPDELDNRVGELVDAKNRWVAHAGDRSYSYQFQAGANPGFTIVVTEPGLLRDDWMENPPCLEPNVCRIDPSMRELFQLVLDLTGEHLESGGRLEVDYDEELGYPKRILWDDRSGSHSELVIYVSEIVFVDT